MPEFILDYGSPDGARMFNALDSFTQGYIEAAFFTDTGSADDSDLENASVAELAPSAIERAKADCAEFQKAQAALLALAFERYYPDDYCESIKAAGRDFWFTRNGHGVGFWDRDALNVPVWRYGSRGELCLDGAAEDGDSMLGALGDLLSDACRHRETGLYRGDDGLIYFE